MYNPMQSYIINTIEEFEAMNNHWKALFSIDDQNPLPLCFEWLYSWWKVFKSDKQLHIICVYENGHAIAIAPMMREEISYRGFKVDCIKLMANGHSPFCGIIYRSNLTFAKKYSALECIINACKSDLLIFNKIAKDSLTCEMLKHMDLPMGFHRGTKPSLLTPFIHTSGDWDLFFQNRPRRFRKNIHNKINRIIKAKDFSVTEYKIHSSSDPIFEEIIDVSKNSWKYQLESDLSSKPESKDFIASLIDQFGPDGAIHIWILRKHGKAIAFELQVHFNGVAYPIRADFDDHYRQFSPGSVLEYEAIKALFNNESIQFYNSCADNYWYLHNWTNEIRERVTFEIFPKTSKSLLLYVVEHIGIRYLRELKMLVIKIFNKDETQFATSEHK